MFRSMINLLQKYFTIAQSHDPSLQCTFPSPGCRKFDIGVITIALLGRADASPYIATSAGEEKKIMKKISIAEAGFSTFSWGKSKLCSFYNSNGFFPPFCSDIVLTLIAMLLPVAHQFPPSWGISIKPLLCL